MSVFAMDEGADAMTLRMAPIAEGSQVIPEGVGGTSTILETDLAPTTRVRRPMLLANRHPSNTLYGSSASNPHS